MNPQRLIPNPISFKLQNILSNYSVFEEDKFLEVEVGKGFLPLAGVEIRDKAGPQDNCPQNLARAHKMLRAWAQMALEIVGSFQYLMYKRYKKNLAVKKLRALNFSISGAQVAPGIFGIF